MRDESEGPREPNPLLKDWYGLLEPVKKAAHEIAAPRSKLAAIYRRRSTRDERDVSVDRQGAVCIEYCQRNGLDYKLETLLFTDRHRSGTTMKGRTSFLALLAAARARLFDVLVVEGSDRPTRDVVDALEIMRVLDEGGIELHVAFRGRINLVEMAFRSLQAQQDRERIVWLNRQGLRQAAAEGRFLGRHKVYGYDSHPEENCWTINQVEAAILKEIFRAIDEDDLSLYGIAKRLNDEEIFTHNGTPWTTSLMFLDGHSGALLNPLLIGEYMYGRFGEDPVVVALPDLAIIDRDRYFRVIAKLIARKRPRPPAKPKGTELLAHNVVCEGCGGPMTTVRASQGRHYHCHRSDVASRCGETAHVGAVAVERHVLLTIRDRILHQNHRDGFEALRRSEWTALDDAIAPERDLLRAEMDELDARIDAALEPAHTMSMVERASFANDELRHLRLGAALDKLDLPPTISIDAQEAEELRLGISGLLLRLPVDARTQEDVRLVERLRTIVPHVTLRRGAGDGCFHVRCLVGIAPGTEPSCDGYEPDPARWLVRDVTSEGRGIRGTPEVLDHHHAWAAAGAYRFTDRDWGLVASLYEPFRTAAVDPRLLAEGLVMMSATGLPATLLPEPYTFVRRLTWKIRRQGIWASTYDILEKRRSPRIDGLDRGSFDMLPFPSSWETRRGHR